MMYKPPMPLKEYKKIMKRKSKEVIKRRKRREGLVIPYENIKFINKKDLYLNEIEEEYNYILIPIDVYNNFDTYHLHLLKDKYPELLEYELKLPYGDLRRIGLCNIIETKDNRPNIALMTCKKEVEQIDKDGLMLCLKRLKDILPNGSTMLCGLTGISKLFPQVVLDEVIDTIKETYKDTVSITFYRETPIVVSDYYNFVEEYIRKRIENTVRDKVFLKYILKDVRIDRLLQKINLFNYKNKFRDGKKKDKFDF